MAHDLFKRILDILFPPHPDSQSVATLSLEELFSVVSLNYRTPFKTYTVLPYKDIRVRALMRANKYHHDTYAASLLGAVLAEALIDISEEYALDSGWKHPLLVPTPTSPSRVRERGYHQVKQIIERLPSHLYSAYTYADVLARKNRESQARIGNNDRIQNIAGAFYVPEKHQKDVLGKRILLVDDVIESGATMGDMHRALYEAGAESVIGIALAT